jgi:hypothetical protein
VEREEATFQALHPNCASITWRYGSTGVTHCCECCPPSGLSGVHGLPLLDFSSRADSALPRHAPSCQQRPANGARPRLLDSANKARCPRCRPAVLVGVGVEHETERSRSAGSLEPCAAIARIHR